ncbi:SDR family oxidoreductase [Planococcus sp. ISL-109]|uniref:SDR family oxidoreductase n=1 Tax=Planococcus sp. ISL-109 TaxID=2819166 RepID=UPI001BE91F54|nr:SDR family oxidoreductase [Planococcus sp. ISL-109]MBT2581774.1 SDR family oxidoreductase [Planococcus sp. ISL-109]
MKMMVFTGFPGFIATRLMETSAEKGVTLAAIVLASEMEAAKTAAGRIEKQTGCGSIRLLAGDITKPGLALSGEDTQYLQDRELVFWHLAAIYDLAVPEAIARKVNIEGTGHVNDFVKSLKGLKRYMYFSTAYVAGAREGIIREDELIRPEAFKNHYEETKFEAELLVDKLKGELPVTIIRPGIVRGHSKSGETSKFDGPYFFLNMIDRMKHMPVIPYIGHSKATINVVPVDYILEASVYLSLLDEAAGATVHLTDPNPHPVEEVYRAMVHEMTGTYPKGHLPKKLAALSMSIPMVRKYLSVEAETLDYMDWQAKFDTQRAQALLQESDIKCADFLETMPAMVAFYKEHRADKNYQVPIT